MVMRSRHLLLYQQKTFVCASRFKQFILMIPSVYNYKVYTDMHCIYVYTRNMK